MLMFPFLRHVLLLGSDLASPTPQAFSVYFQSLLSFWFCTSSMPPSSLCLFWLSRTILCYWSVSSSLRLTSHSRCCCSLRKFTTHTNMIFLEWVNHSFSHLQHTSVFPHSFCSAWPVNFASCPSYWSSCHGYTPYEDGGRKSFHWVQLSTILTQHQST